MENELLDSRLLSKISGLMFKIDFYKTFDCVRWDLLDNILALFSFGGKWLSWPQTCWKMPLLPFSLMIL